MSRDRALFKRRCCSECGTITDSGEITASIGPLTIDRSVRSVTWKGQPVRLTPQQFEILELLVQRTDRLVQRWAFFCGVLDEESAENQLDVQVTRIRAAFKAVDPDFDHLRTIRGEGLMWLCNVTENTLNS